MTEPRFTELLAQPTLAYKQRIEKEERAMQKSDISNLRRLASSAGDARSPAASRLLRSLEREAANDRDSASAASVASNASSFSSRLRRIELTLEEERRGREEVHTQLLRLQQLIEQHIAARTESHSY